MPVVATTIHGQHCRCRLCPHDDRPPIGWGVVTLVTVAGSAAMLFDACGFTPWLAGLLGMLR